MKKLFKYTTLIGILLLTGFVAISCDDVDDIVNPDFDRLFSPIDLKGTISNKTGVRVTWTETNGAEAYILEVIKGADESGEKVGSYTITPDEIPYTVTGLEGETDYTIRVKATTNQGKDDSKWSVITVTTGSEQIFYSVSDDDLKATEVTLRWPAGETATQIILTPGDITHAVTSADITAGAATISGLSSETKYTAKLMNGSKTRGTIEFTTKIDLGDAIAIYPEDDIIAKLDAAEEGDSFVLFPGEYALGDYALTKSITIAGYLSSDKPVIYGRFTCGATINSFTLKTVIMDGEAEGEAQKTNVFEVASGCNLNSLSITDSELRNYQRTLIYNNTSGTSLGDILISNCIISGFGNSGGDGIDIRTGAMSSLTVENSTFNGGFRAFLRVQVTSNVVFKNCTFYKICAIDDSNNSGLFRSSTGGTFEVSKCLFVETGVDSPTNVQSGNWCRNSGNMKATATYSNNVYYSCYNLWVGLYTDPSACNAKELNPQFKDAANSDFTVQNPDVEVGDPRWLP